MMNSVKVKQTYHRAVQYLISRTKINPLNVVLSGGGALVLMKLKAETEDLDLTIPQNDWDKLNLPVEKVLYGPQQTEVQYKRFIQDGVQCDVHPGLSDASAIGSIMVATIDTMIQERIKCGREKDLAVIKLLEQYRKDKETTIVSVKRSLT